MLKQFYTLTYIFSAILLLTVGCGVGDDNYNPSTDTLRFSGENHLRNIKQLTFGGNNAEAYWSFDNKQLVFQSDWAEINPQGCDQIFIMNADGSTLPTGEQYQLVSTGKGRTTCSFFLKGDKKVVYASTHQADEGLSGSTNVCRWQICLANL